MSYCKGQASSGLRSEHQLAKKLARLSHTASAIRPEPHHDTASAGLPQRECVWRHASQLLEELLHLPHADTSGELDTVRRPGVDLFRPNGRHSCHALDDVNASLSLCDTLHSELQY